jgi:hypothetical protein
MSLADLLKTNETNLATYSVPGLDVLRLLIEGCSNQLGALQDVLDKVTYQPGDSVLQRGWKRIVSVYEDKMIRKLTEDISQVKNSMILWLSNAISFV